MIQTFYTERPPSNPCGLLVCSFACSSFAETFWIRLWYRVYLLELFPCLVKFNRVISMILADRPAWCRTLYVFFLQSRSLTSFKGKENYFTYVIISMFSNIFSTFLGFKCSKSSRQKYRLPHPRHFLAALTNQMQAIQIALIWLVRKLDTWLWRSPPFSITISLILASWRHCGNFCTYVVAIM